MVLETPDTSKVYDPYKARPQSGGHRGGKFRGGFQGGKNKRKNNESDGGRFRSQSAPKFNKPKVERS